MPRSPLRVARKIFQDRDLNDTEGKKAGLAFSWPILGVLALFVTGAIAWAFFMGFMVGQGHNPNTKLQEITGLSLPIQDEKETPSEETPDLPQVTEEVPAQESAPPKEKTDLAFRAPTGKELGAWGEAPRPTPPPVKKDKPVKAEKEELFDFSFQIAAFKSQADAENLQKKLTKIGVKTKIQKSGKVALLIANIRGPANTPENLNKKLTPLKLGKPLQISKKPFVSKAKRNK